jgi:hypothetical protein
MTEQNFPGIPEERVFIWRNLEAYLAGSLNDADRSRFETIMASCPATRQFVQAERSFAQAINASASPEAATCPDGLRERILAALDRCDVEEAEYAATVPAPRGVMLGFPWVGAALMSAASVMLVVALVLMFGNTDSLNVDTPSQADSLPRTLSPVLATVSLDVPRSERCRYRAAREEYEKHFADAPALPREVDGSKLRVSHFSCDEVNGDRVMCAVYDSQTGDRFAMVVFKRRCLKGCAPDEMKAVEVVVDGRVVVLWRDGEYFRALVGTNAAVLRRHMSTMRKAV